VDLKGDRHVDSPTTVEVSQDPQARTGARAHRGVALLIVTLTILIALVAFAPLTGAGQLSGQTRDPESGLQAQGSVSGSSQPSSPLFLPAVNYPSGGKFAFFGRSR
jgi:hypothetical protein